MCDDYSWAAFVDAMSVSLRFYRFLELFAKLRNSAVVGLGSGGWDEEKSEVYE